MENTRSQFPRLYFVSNEELIEALATPQNAHHLLPVTRRCFPGIDNILFELPDSHPQTTSTRWSSAINCKSLLLLILKHLWKMLLSKQPPFFYTRQRLDLMRLSLVPSHSCLSLFDHWQVCSNYTDESESKPNHAPQGGLPATTVPISRFGTGSEHYGLHTLRLRLMVQIKEYIIVFKILN